ncbi:decarboxylating NADP(+)-dependent phosphogluconate dehydrogenase [Reichenbachiella ulvae]|uniref:6-phosphogluconate dehydrogenase, decarboxylating n=1 Tax=Reichenbachiella ulvae TaxID=2980104 RepID=A0ABT3CZY5_9BACT|nr:decarboxylating NADP(+)-dependent phosphogluconate dehydrogenase [Reichenbachiella ulvae]MCV9389123.1 decarboxylating NADP(+)-dependent phosphogluconate dehydrogenase [Reichenbachiella ulvae]
MQKTTDKPIVIVFGVSGSGKSTIGQLLSQHLSVPFADADDYHPQKNIDKMASGQPLNDQDRESWLLDLAGLIDENKEKGLVLACSALKEKYRKILSSGDQKIHWVHLAGTKEVLTERLQQRKQHFFNPALLDSQLATLEKPKYGIEVNVEDSPEEIINTVLESMSSKKSEFGLIGLGVMGKSLTLNLANHGVEVLAYNRQAEGEEHIVPQFLSENSDKPNLRATNQLKEFISELEIPRKIMLMVNAGAAVDAVIEDLLPSLDPGDIIIDGGNSHYHDTKRRNDYLKEKGIHFVGCGVSGGEEGALKGPSMMPGGDKEAYEKIAPYLERIAARDKNDEGCCTYIGREGAGHFVKMVHNGIEYAEMQLIAETYAMLRTAGMPIDQMAELFEDWNQGDLKSYLLEITADLLTVKDGDEYLIDLIYDAAGQKGTGGWSTTAALDVGVPFSTISESVMARCLSAQKPLRIRASRLYGERPVIERDLQTLIPKIKQAYQSARVINHAIGFEMIKKTSEENNWGINLSQLARIWTNGCIIRSSLMEELVSSFKASPEEHMLLAPSFVDLLKGSRKELTEAVSEGLQMFLSLPVYAAALNYLNGFTNEQSSANIIQAQRDYFGAHTFQRKDKPLSKYFHSQWTNK